MTKNILFPKEFKFGIAESDLQTVGSLLPQQKEESQKPMWEVFANAKKIDAPLYGSFKFDNYKKDAELVNNLGVKAYRTSVSMSRILDKHGNINKKSILWYKSYFSALKSEGIELHLCLYHWEAPQQFLKNGILDRDFLPYFIKHTDAVIDHLGEFVDYYIPINELWCIDFLSYIVGIHAPGEVSTEKFFKAYFASIHLQAEIVKHIKKRVPESKVGIVNIHFPSYIQENKLNNQKYLTARHLADNLTNFIYSDPFFFGTVDEAIIKKFHTYFPKDYKEILQNAKINNLLNYYGVNYYTSQYVKPSINDLGYEQELPEGALTNSLGWPVALPPYYPNGLVDILSIYAQRYYSAGLKNIIVSENGTPAYTNSSTQQPQDDFRIFYITEHLKQVQEAIAKGVPVTGYFLWTLLDNYEWQEGYRPESAFGLVRVHKQTGERIPKKSYYWYKSLLTQLYK